MSISRWEPWGDIVSLRAAMDRLLEESFVRPPWTGGREGAAASLAVDVEERADDFVVTAPIPGIRPEDVELSVLGNTLRVRAERREERQEGGEGKRWLLREQRYGAFERAVTLPAPVKADQATAEFRDGVLTITLPKTEEAKERRIRVLPGGQRRPQPVEVEAREVH